MKTIKYFACLALFAAFTSCSTDDNSGDENELLETETATVSNLAAVQTADYTTTPATITGDYTRFSFESGSIVTDDSWDLAFRGTTILVNGGTAVSDDEPERTGTAGVYIASGTLSSITEVDTSLFVSDSETDGLAITTGSENGWYSYDYTTHIISPIAGKILVVKTSNNTYAKVEILSYYLDSDTSSDSQYYTFNYVYQPNEGETTF